MSLAESIRKLNNDPKNKWALIILGVILCVALYLNWDLIVSGEDSESGADSNIAALNDAIKRRDEAIKRFVKTVQPRAASFRMIKKGNATSVGIEMQNAVRNIADKVKYNILTVNPPRTTKVKDSKEIKNAIETIDVPFSGLDTWEKTLSFMSAVETSFPNFYWGQLSLSKKGKDERISLNGTLKLILIRDEKLAATLQPSIDAARTALEKEDPNFSENLDEVEEDNEEEEDSEDEPKSKPTSSSKPTNMRMRR